MKIFKISIGKQKVLAPDLKQLSYVKFAKSGSVKERFIDAEGNIEEVFRPGLETRLSQIGVGSITKHIRKSTAKNPIIDYVEIQGRVTEKNYKFVNSNDPGNKDLGKAKRDAFDFLRKGISARRAGFATTI